MLPVALTIAGSDSSAGAGIQADLKTFTACDVHGLTALTCAVSESALEVGEIVTLDPAFTAAQIALLIRHFPVAAAKTGMLPTAAHVEAVAACLAPLGIPVVVDPVMVASTGDPLIAPEAITAYQSHLIPVAALLTPNLDEAQVLLGGQPITAGGLNDAAMALTERFQCPVLLKGGHLAGPEAIDVLARPGQSIHRFASPFVRGAPSHGTGCTYSAAITAGLARGFDLVESITRAKAFIQHALATGITWNGPSGPIGALNQSGRGFKP